MAWEPDRRSNFFFNPPAHLCAVTYMTEISLIVTLNNKLTTSLLTGKERLVSEITRSDSYALTPIETPRVFTLLADMKGVPIALI